MGNCFKSCLPESRAAKAFRNLNILDDSNHGVDFTFLVDDASSIAENSKRSIISKLFRRSSNKKPVLGLVDTLLSAQTPTYGRLNRDPSFTGSSAGRDIQLESLDARALLERTAASSPASSLDLEWEHEALEVPMVLERSRSTWIAFPENVSCHASDSSPAPSVDRSAVSESDWSRVSSLEWDNVQNPIPPASPPLSEVDADTQFLLCEIERLTNKTLEETGRDLFR